MNIKLRTRKQDEWFDKALIKYGDAREQELLKENPLSSGIVRHLVCLECSIIRYNYIYQTRPFDEPLADDDPENINGSLSSNLMNDLYGELDFESETYKKYISAFLDND